jgi:hypothetical protein
MVKQNMKQRLPKILLTLLISATLSGSLSAEDAKAEDAKAEDAKAEDAKAEDAKAEDAKAEDAKAEDANAEDANAEDANAEDAKGEDAKAEDAKGEDAKAEETQAPPPETTNASEIKETDTAATENTAPETEPPPPSPAAQAAVALELDEPTTAESKTIAWVFAGLTAASLAGGVYAGLQAQEQFNCLSDILSCNESRDTPIENDDFLKAKSDLDRVTLLADMGYLTAVVTGTVTIAAIVRAMGSETSEAQAPITSMLTLPQE